MVANNLLSAYGWFAGLLVVMIFITLLFGVILVIALRPIKRETRGDNNSTKKQLSQRQAEITAELLNSKDADKKHKEELIEKLGRVKAAEEVVDEIIKEEKAVSAELDAEEAKKSGKKPAKRPTDKKPVAAKPPKQPKEKKSSKEFKPAGLDAPEQRGTEEKKPEKPEDKPSEEKK